MTGSQIHFIVIIYLHRFFGCILFYLARTDIQKPNRQSPCIEKWKSADRYRPHIFIGIWFVWFYFYNSCLYTKYTGLDCVSIRHAHGTGSNNNCISHAHHRYHFKQRRSTTISRFNGYADLCHFLFLGLFYTYKQLLRKKTFSGCS